MDYGQGGGWSGPSQRRAAGSSNPLEAAMQSFQTARSGGELSGRYAPQRIQVLPDEDAQFAAQLAADPNIVGPGDERLSPDASPEEAMRYATQPRSFQVGGRPYQRDPRIGLGLELARAQQARGVQEQGQADQATRQQQMQDQRVERLVAAGYSQKEATRQVFGGARTVAEEQELVNTRSADQLAKDKLIQSDISERASARDAARSNLQQLLERSRSGDRNASRQLAAQKALLGDATRAHSAAMKARTANALGGVDLGDAALDPEDVKLNAAVDDQLNDVQSTEAARQGAIAGIKRASNSGQPGADGVSDTDAAAFLGVRQPTTLNDGSTGSVTADPMAKYHRAFQRGALPRQTGPGQGLPTAPKPLEDHQHAAATTDPGYRAWLMNKGYDVSNVPNPDEQNDQQDDDAQDFSQGDDQAAAY